jgi:hypothetical protein
MDEYLPSDQRWTPRLNRAPPEPVCAISREIEIQWFGFYETQTNHIHPIQDLRHPLYPSSLMPIRIWTARADRTVPTHRLPPEQSDTAVNGSSGVKGLAGPPHGDPAPQISINRTLCEKEVKANLIIVHLLAIETQLVLLTAADPSLSNSSLRMVGVLFSFLSLFSWFGTAHLDRRPMAWRRRPVPGT